MWIAPRVCILLVVIISDYHHHFSPLSFIPTVTPLTLKLNQGCYLGAAYTYTADNSRQQLSSVKVTVGYMPEQRVDFTH